MQIAQPTLFTDAMRSPFNEPPIRFDGVTYDAQLDGKRLANLGQRVFELMKDGRWRTLQEIRLVCGGSEAGISSRIRDLRKPKFGGYLVESRRVKEGLWVYRLMVEKEEK